MKPDSIRTIAMGGVISALVMLATYILKIPTFIGYINLGDAAIFASAVILGPFAGVSAAIGSAMADLIGAYGQYAPATFIIKGSMGLLAGLVLKKRPNLSLVGAGVLFVICEVIMVGGYLIFETIIYDFRTALAAVPYNSLQAVAGVTLGIVSLPFVRRLRILQNV